ncbi:MAG: DUF1016 family protein, partial [Pedobacter sp.]
GSKYADECYNGNFIGANFGIQEDLSPHLYDNWRDFNKRFIPIWMDGHPGKSKISAGLACGALWTVAKGIQKGDVVLCPNGAGAYFVGEITDNYSYHPDEILPHRRTVRWYSSIIDRTSLSDALKKSAGSIGTVSNVSGYAQEIESLLAGTAKPQIVATDETIEDAAVFGLEKHLEEFLIQNWKVTELGQTYNIYEEDGQLVGQQYPSDTGPIDILAISKDKKELLVVELKKGRASDSVVGQIQRYMGYVKQELAEDHQTVKGVIIALDDDLRIRRALAVATNIEFFRYQVSFKLFKT